MKSWFNKTFKYFLLLLFLGYYGSITLFTHTHHFENGAIIVHSHPYKAGSDKNPVNHQHSTNAFILIQFLSTFLTTLSFLSFAIAALNVISLFIVYHKADKFSNLVFIGSNGLRAPPHTYTIFS